MLGNQRTDLQSLLLICALCFELLARGVASASGPSPDVSAAAAAFVPATAVIAATAASPVARDTLATAFREVSEQSLAVPAGNPDRFFVQLTLDGHQRTLELQRHSIRARSFTLLVLDDATSGVPREVDPPAVRTYRGRVAGVADSSVAASLVDGRLSATIHLDEATFVVEPIEKLAPDRAAEATHIVYRGADVIPAPGECGSDSLDAVEVEPPAAEGGIAGASMSLAEIVIDVDYEFFQVNGSSVPQTVADVELVMNSVDEVFRRDVNIGYIITTLLIRTSAAESYTEQEIYARLCKFREVWNQPPLKLIRRDIAHHLAGAVLSGGPIGIAWRPGVCNPTGTPSTSTCVAGATNGSLGYGISETFYQGPTTALFRRVGLTAHELGHNWNAVHCNDEGAENCHIMCSTINGCGGIAGDNLKFDPSSIQQMTSYAANISCTPPIELDTIFYTGPQRNSTFNGNFTAWGSHCGNIGVSAPKRRFAMPFTVPESSDAGQRWTVRRIVGKGHIPSADGYIPGTLTGLGWDIFKRASGNPAPTDADLIAGGIVPLPISFNDMPNDFAGGSRPIDLPVPLSLESGDYYLSIYGDNGGPSAPAAWAWQYYAQSGLYLLEGGLHAWRSSTGPFLALSGSTHQVQKGDDPNAIYTFAFTVEGTLEPVPCPADLSGNGTVDGADLAAMLGVWGACASCAADLNGDGAVNGADLAMLLGSWGPCG